MTDQKLLDFLEDQVYILDATRRVVQANQAARLWMDENGLRGALPAFSAVLARLGAPGVLGDGPGGLEVYLSHTPCHAVFQMKERVVEEGGSPAGYFVTLTDVTRYRALIDQMEQLMGIDPLTGLGNRYLYEKRCRELKSAPPPFSVLIGDVNELKQVNDSFGHEQGDRLLQVCAKAMEEVFSPHGEVFRIGGDEIVALMPGVDYETASLLATLFEAQLSTCTGLPRLPTVATGVATRTRIEQSIEEVARIADLSMYANKKNDRRKNSADHRRVARPDPPVLGSITA